MNSLSIVLAACAVWGSAPAALAQSTWHVDGSATDCPGDGSQQKPYCSIQYAIDQPSTLSGDTILVLPGTYAESLAIATKSLNLIARDGPDLTTLLNVVVPPASIASTIVVAGTPGISVAIEGFTIHCGRGHPVIQPLYGSGGGIYCRQANLLVSNCRLVPTPNLGHGPLYGGGLCVEQGTLTILDSTLSELPASFGGGIASIDSVVRVEQCTISECGKQFDTVGGGIYCDTNTVEVVDSFIVDNSSTQGGGILGPARVSGSTIAGNYSESSGGGIDGGSWGYLAEVADSLVLQNWSDLGHGAGVMRARVMDSDLIENTGSSTFSRGGGASNSELDSCLLQRNDANRGGGASESTLDRCAVLDNHAPAGGGLYSSIANYTIIAGNTATRLGAAAFCELDHCTVAFNVSGLVSSSGCVSGLISNSIVWDNTPSAPEPATFASFSDIEGGWPGLGNLDEDPLFWNGRADDFHLLPGQVGLHGSPCIDAGDPTFAPDPDGSPTDMGALWADPALCLERYVYCTAKVNALGCVPKISAVGTPSASGVFEFRIECHDVTSGAPGMLIYSKTGKSAAAILGGFLCIQGPIRRTASQSSGGNPPPSDCSGVFSFDFNDLIASGADPELVAGRPVWAQFWYRDPQHPDGTGVGLSDALQFMICP